MNCKVILTIFLLLGTLKVMACDCKEVKSIEEEYNYSKSIVTGKIISKERVVVTDSQIIEYIPNSKPYNGRIIMKYKLVVDETIKGKFKTRTVDVYTGLGGGDCGFKFNVGKNYLIYGIDGIRNERIFTDKHKSLWTINCLRTKLIDKKEIKKLKQIIIE